MNTISVVPAVLYFLCCGVLGIRLIRRGLTEKQVPELGLGVFFLVGVCVGFLINSALLVFGWEPAHRGLWAGIAMLAANAGIAALLLFVWRVFRASEVWAAVLFALLVAALGLLTVLRLVTTGIDTARHGDWVEICWYVGLAISFAWTTAECGRAHRRSMRQAALGLAELSVARQFQLWTWASALQVAVFVFITLLLSMGRSTTEPGPSAAIMVMCSFSTGFIWYGVFPSRRMRHKLEARSAGDEQTSD